VALETRNRKLESERARLRHKRYDTGWKDLSGAVDIMGRILIAHGWRWPKVLIALLIIEFPLTVACLALFGIADPDTYRTKLWQNGSDQGFNSNPNEIIYSYANYKPISTPMVWSS
jgi:hypothetical protein